VQPAATSSVAVTGKMAIGVNFMLLPCLSHQLGWAAVELKHDAEKCEAVFGRHHALSL
jgi:hypothetical protein